MNTIQDAKILVVDDQTSNIDVLQDTFRHAGYNNVRCLSDAREVAGSYLEWQPDLVLLDLHMPYLDGFEVMEQLREIPGSNHVPILVLTADNNAPVRQRALECGAMDFITKPFHICEVLLRTHNFLQTRQMYLELKSKNLHLEEMVKERTVRLENSQIEMMERLAHVAECHDYETSEHTYRVGNLAASIGREMGMNEAEVSLLRRAAALHDIGKLAIPDSICLKPGQLTPAEFEVMKTHVQAGAHLLQDGHSEIIQMAETIALTHHERFDGRGYPAGLKGEQIPLVGRIVALADVFDALLQKRPYKDAWSIQDAFAEIAKQSGTHFDPAVVEAFFSLNKHNEHGQWTGHPMSDTKSHPSKSFGHYHPHPTDEDETGSNFWATVDQTPRRSKNAYIGKL